MCIYIYTPTPVRFSPSPCSFFRLLTYLLIRPHRLKAMVGDKSCLSYILMKFKAIHSLGVIFPVDVSPERILGAHVLC